MYDPQDIKIITDLGYSETNIMQVHRFPDNSIVKEFFDFIWEDMAEHRNPWRVEPFSVFLIRHDTENAFAIPWNGRNIILFHTKLIQVLDEAIHHRVPNALKPGDKLKWALEGYFRQTVPSFMFRLVSLFIYYHELAHLHQAKFANAPNSLIGERYNNLVAGRGFDPVSHAKEIDADIFAGIQVAHRMFNFWSRIPEGHRNTDQLSGMVSLVSAGIFLFCYSMQGGWEEVYFLDGSHPHWLIRTYYIFDCITKTMHGTGNVGQPLDSDACQRDTFYIAAQLLKQPAGNGLADFWKLFVQNVDAMEDYFHKHMVPISKGLPYLVQWNWPGKEKHQGGAAEK